MASFGLFPEGLLIPSLDDVESDMRADARDRFGPNLPLSETTLFGFMITGVSERIQLVWQGVQQVFAAGDIDQATGLPLRTLGTISGVLAPDPSPSSVVETLCGDPGTVVPDGTVIRTPDTLKDFVTIGDGTGVTLSPLVSRSATTTYAEFDRVTNASRCYQCTVGGETDSGSGPVTTDVDIVDGGAHWTYIGEGTAVVDVIMNSVDVGPIEAIARGLTSIANPIPGLNTATNLAAAELGTSDLSDEDFRIFQQAEVAAPGTGTVEAIRAELLKLSGVTVVDIFENTTEVTDVNGLPGHCIEPLVQGGTDQDILDTLLANVPAGTGTHGNVSGTSVDSEGKAQPFSFSRPVPVSIYLDITLLEDSTAYPGDDAVKAAIAAVNPEIGVNVVASRIASQVFSVAGVEDVPRTGSLGGVLIGLAPGPTSDVTLVIGSRQVAAYSTARITIHSSSV